MWFKCRKVRERGREREREREHYIIFQMHLNRHLIMNAKDCVLIYNIETYTGFFIIPTDIVKQAKSYLLVFYFKFTIF